MNLDKKESFESHLIDIIINKLHHNTNIAIKKISRKNIMSANAETRKDDKEEVLATNKKIK